MKKLHLPKPTLQVVWKAIVTVVICSSLFAGGYYLGASKNPQKLAPNVILDRVLPTNQKDLHFSLFWTVWDTLTQKYYDKSKLIPANMVYGAIQGMVAAVGDPYTAFIPPEQYKSVQEDLSGSFEGVGIQIGFKGTTLAVIAPLPGSPADKAGVKAGDLIVGIVDKQKDIDTNTSGITLPRAVEIIRGPAGSEVTLFLVRDGVNDPIEVTIKRENIEVDSVAVEFLGDNKQVAHISLLKFSGDTLEQWNQVVAQTLKQGSVESVILDLRNDPGGYLEAAVTIASDFVDPGKVIVLEAYSDGTTDKLESHGVPRLKGKKVVVLMNGGSASASEILAGALRDISKVQLIGEQSFGKGTIQEPQTVEDGSGLHITVAKWLTPNGTWVNEVGLTPDVEVEDNPDTPEDEQLLKALEVLGS